MKSILIVEDEFSIAMDIESQLKLIGYNVIGIADSHDEALALVEGKEVDLLLMDININGSKNGIESAEILTEICNAPVIFLTAYSEDKILSEALKVKPAGYLLKPFEVKHLKTTIKVGLAKSAELKNQAIELGILKKGLFSLSDDKSNSKDYLFIKDKNKIVKIKTNDILRLEAMGNYTLVFDSDGRKVVNMFLRDLLAKLDLDFLIRIHRSHVINFNHIDSLNGNTIQIGEDEIPIGRNYKPELMEKLDIIS